MLSIDSLLAKTVLSLAERNNLKEHLDRRDCRQRQSPGFVVAAPRSGAGKTTVTLGVMRALRRRGLAVQPFKCGPDYIDPAFHAAASGRDSFNLDTWCMRPQLIADLIARATDSADIAVVEGVMGLFDGVLTRGQTGRGATADLAALTGWPVVLVLDVSAQAETAAAIALGCKLYRDDIQLAGVILNRVASGRHEAMIRPAMERLGLPVLGCLARRDAMTLPERHLGLVQAGELDALEAYLETLGDQIAAQVSLDDLVSAATTAHGALSSSVGAAPLAPPGGRIALARDRAFSFVYAHVVEGWRSAGAEIVPFSPLADEPPDPAADAVWLPGGYPELHAGMLAASGRFLGGLRGMAARGVVIHGECGGYMTLGAGIEDASGARHEMAGLLKLETSFAKRKLHLGYRRARLLADSALGTAGGVILGHEFHYASVLEAGDEPLLAVTDANDAQICDAGSRRGSVAGTFFHAIDQEGLL
jgi:cobyrinic acid a,c-diamide synthase